MIKNMLSNFWFWGFMLVAFVTIILWDDDVEENAKGNYVKHRMSLDNVNVSQIENGFEHSRMYATKCEMDDSQSNMEANDIKVLFFKEEIATYTGHLIAASATKSPFEAKFFGNVRLWNTDNERMKTEEMRYLFNRKELSTQKPITAWKDNAVLTGLGMTYNTESQELTVNQQVVIRVWDEKKEAPKPVSDKDPMSGLPIAEPIEKILGNIASKSANIATASDKLASDAASQSANIVTASETNKSSTTGTDK